MKLDCPYFQHAICASCSWIETPYLEQIKRKEARVYEVLKPMGDFELEETQRSDLSQFRNRAKFSVSGTEQNPIIGLLGEVNLDEGREILNCPIHRPRINQLVQALPDFIRRFRLVPYQIQERTGELKGIIVYDAPGEKNHGELQLRFILRSKECVSRIRKLLPELLGQFPDLKCVSANIQPVPHAILEGAEELILTENSTVELTLSWKDRRLKLQVAPQAFVQTHSVLAEKLYQTAAEWIAAIRPQKVAELYCGLGAFSLMTQMAMNGEVNTLGVEVNPLAVLAAQQTALTHGYKNAEFKAADAATVFELLASYSASVILVNPPRRGLGQSIPFIRKLLPQSFIYSSCSIESLGKDLAQLKEQYRLKKVKMFDFFPHTHHFETLVWLERR